MGQMHQEHFVCIDCETTGLDSQKDQIIEVAAMHFSLNETFGGCEYLVDPQCAIPDSSIAIHHITQEMVTGKPLIAEVLPEIIELIGDRIIVGHGVGFDVEVLALAADKAGIPCKIRKNPTLDTLRMARHYGDSPINSLEQLRRHFNIEQEGAHRAMNDVIVNTEVFRYLAKRFRTTQQLFETLSKPILMKVMPLGPHKGRLMKDVPLQYLLWAANKDFDQDLLFSLRTEINRRKKGNLFSQSGNPFKNL
jgi:DNA polymerase III subunit epsilon